MIDLALILAAGLSSRFKTAGAAPHKALVPLEGRPILSRICLHLQSLGIREAIVVTGYRGAEVRAMLAGQADLDLELSFVENPQWGKANGLSVLAAAHRLTRNYLLMMCDHIFDPAIVESLCRTPLENQEVILAVDRKLDTIYDMEDATKVRLSEGRIAAIGKQLNDFNAIDTGFFACTEILVEALRCQAETGDCSLSDGMRRIAETGSLRYFDIGSRWWQDIDTPDALRHAEGLCRGDWGAAPPQRLRLKGRAARVTAGSRE